ncbi:MAG: glycosyltransferase [Bacteroidetes bacterium]|nr:glycosyltransferase [Bacteroidota bacterium]HET6244687.1 glycosyltransferase [Bacteroidia bacterium]
MTNSALYIVSASYPFGKGEEFVQKELVELSKYFDKIYLFPLTCLGKQRWLPDNVELNLSLANTSRLIEKKQFLLDFFLLAKILLLELMNSGKKSFILSNIRELFNSILQTHNLAKVFSTQIKEKKNIYFYSTWMNDGALMLAILKEKGLIPHFVFRLHGYDLFDDRRKGNYMPFRYFNFKNASKIFILSKAGLEYIMAKNIFPQKLILSYFGTYDHGINAYNKNEIFTIVSCSNVIRLKRIDKIIQTLSHVDFPLHWIHFGDGELMHEIKNLALTLPSHVAFEFKGHTSNEEVLEFYQKNSVNLFMHLSDTEGFGVAIVEAQSFGIPALAVKTGGVPEIVNETTGILILLDKKPEQIADLVYEFKTSAMNSKEYQKLVKQHWQLNFEAVKNYGYFYEKIVEN